MKTRKTTECYATALPSGAPNDVTTQVVNEGRPGNRPATLIWTADFNKLRKARKIKVDEYALGKKLCAKISLNLNEWSLIARAVEAQLNKEAK